MQTRQQMVFVFEVPLVSPTFTAATPFMFGHYLLLDLLPKVQV